MRALLLAAVEARRQGGGKVTEYHWSDLRDKACEQFGDTPSPTTESAILAVFQRRPAAVARELEAVARDVRAGKLRSGWGAARHRIGQLDATEAVATDEEERRRKLRAAVAFVRNVGQGFPTEDELVDELFGERGRFRDWPDLRDEVLEVWRAVG